MCIFPLLGKGVTWLSCLAAASPTKPPSFASGVEDRTYTRCHDSHQSGASPSVPLPPSSFNPPVSPPPSSLPLSGKRTSPGFLPLISTGAATASNSTGLPQQGRKISSSGADDADPRHGLANFPQDPKGEDIIASSLAARAAAEASSRAAEALLGRLRGRGELLPPRAGKQGVERRKSSSSTAETTPAVGAYQDDSRTRQSSELFSVSDDLASLSLVTPSCRVVPAASGGYFRCSYSSGKTAFSGVSPPLLTSSSTSQARLPRLTGSSPSPAEERIPEVPLDNLGPFTEEKTPHTVVRAEMKAGEDEEALRERTRTSRGEEAASPYSFSGNDAEQDIREERRQKTWHGCSSSPTAASEEKKEFPGISFLSGGAADGRRGGELNEEEGTTTAGFLPDDLLYNRGASRSPSPSRCCFPSAPSPPAGRLERPEPPSEEERSCDVFPRHTSLQADSLRHVWGGAVSSSRRLLQWP